MLKKVAESRWNARLNSDDEQEEDAEGADGGWEAKWALARPQPILYEERRVEILFIETSGALAGEVRQLPGLCMVRPLQTRVGWRSFGTTLCRSSAKLPVHT